MFDIRFVSGPEVDQNRRFLWGRIIVGALEEEFQTPLAAWCAADYARQWRRAAELLVHGAPCAVFLTHMVEPGASYHIGWPAWRENQQVYVQERLFLAERLPRKFDPARPEQYVGPRQETSEEGLPISQWEIRLADVTEYLQREYRA